MYLELDTYSYFFAGRMGADREWEAVLYGNASCA
jgi:hypothetical protein